MADLKDLEYDVDLLQGKVRELEEELRRLKRALNEVKGLATTAAGDFAISSPPGGHCQVDEKLADRPPSYSARARREQAILRIRKGGQPQLDNTV